MYQKQLMENCKIYVNSDASFLLAKVQQILAREGTRSYLVGGFVRDMLLGRDSGDIDIAVASSALETAAKVAAALNGKYIPLDKVNEIGRVVLFGSGKEGTWELDFSTLKDSIENDLAQRDFTIDAMAVELEEITLEFLTAKPISDTGTIILDVPGLIDPFNGHDDLRQGTIRAVSEPAFPADPARLLRAVRLAAELGFNIDGETEALIRKYAHLITTVAGERIRDELLPVFNLPGTAALLNCLDRLGLLTELIPELSPARGVDQPLIHYWDVFNHSIQTVAAVDFLLEHEEWPHIETDLLAAVPWSEELSQHFNQEISHGSTRKALLKLAALLHDIAKPATKTVDEDGRARFLGHGREGSAITTAILQRLRFSTRETRMVEIMVREHLRPTQMSNHDVPSRHAIYRYFRDTDDTGIEILFLSMADHLATRGPTLNLTEWQAHARMVEYVLTKRLEEEQVTKPPKLIDGHDLINIFGLEPGPAVGELLEAVREAQAAGEIAVREQALDYVKLLITNDRHIIPDK